jgi:predicted PurR-regulated permease PerM
MGQPNRRFFLSTALIVVAVVLGVAASLIAIWLVRETIVWLVAAGFLAFSIEPLIRFFMRHGMGRGLAVTVAFLTIVVVILFFAFAILPAIVDGARGLKEKIPDYVDQVQSSEVTDAVNGDQAAQSAGDAAQGAAKFFENSDKVMKLVGGLASAGFAAFMIFTFTLYFLAYGRELVARFSGLLPPHYREPFRDSVRHIFVLYQVFWFV